jgi:hypothetical protein
VRGPVPERLASRQGMPSPGQRERDGADGNMSRFQLRTAQLYARLAPIATVYDGLSHEKDTQNWEKRCILLSAVGKRPLTSRGFPGGPARS